MGREEARLFLLPLHVFHALLSNVSIAKSRLVNGNSLTRGCKNGLEFCLPPRGPMIERVYVGSGKNSRISYISDLCLGWKHDRSNAVVVVSC